MFGIQGQDENSTEKKSHGSEFIHCVELEVDRRAGHFRAKMRQCPKMLNQQQQTKCSSSLVRTYLVLKFFILRVFFEARARVRIDPTLS